MTRERLPNRRASLRFTVDYDGQRYTATLSRFDDGRIAEIFLDAAKPDSQLAVHANDAAVLASLLLQHGVSAAAIRHSISGPIATALAKIDDEERAS
jgi:ribonucleoside-diphosphate reductase alpha chain